MTKRFANVLVAFSLFSPALVLADPSGSLPDLLALAQKDAKACEEESKKIVSAGGEVSGEADGNPYFGDPKHVSFATDALKKYPGQSKARGEAVRRIREALVSDPGSDTYLFTYSLSGCPTIKMYKFAKALVGSVNRYALSDEEKSRVRASLLSYVGSDLDQPMFLIDFMVRLSILRKMMPEGLVKSPEVEPLVAKTEKIKFKIRAKDLPSKDVDSIEAVTKLPAAKRKIIARLYVEELSDVDGLRADLRKVLASLP